MADLVFAHLTNPSIYPDNEFNYLETQLRNHIHFDFNCTLPDDASPNPVRLSFRFENNEFIMRFSESVQYRGTDVGFAALCREKTMSFQNMDEMKGFIRNMDLSRTSPAANHAAVAAETPTSRPATDRGMISVSRNTGRHINAARLADDIRAFVSGQDRAIEEIARWAAMSASKAHPAKPVCILLAGDTGVGKTYLARNLGGAINRQISGDGEKFGNIVVRCNELSQDHMVARLTGAPAGYVGYSDSTILSPAAENPYQIITFDEIEKASPKVLDVLMSAMDTGEVTLNKPVDGQDTLDLKHAILLFTTNISLDHPNGKNAMGFRAAEPSTLCNSPWEQTKRYRDALVSAGMRPEIAARFTSIIKFDALSSDAVIDIILKAIQECANEFGLFISYVEPSIVQAIYDRIGESKFGARVAVNHVERALGLLFAEYQHDDAAVQLDLTGTLQDPHLTAHEDTTSCQPLNAGQHNASEENDPAEPDWEKDA